MWMRIRYMLLFLFRRKRFDDELAEEMAHHREMLEADKIREGHSPVDAVSGAARQFGNSTVASNCARDVWAIAWFEALVTDMRHVVRRSFKQPASTCIAILALALGIGAVSAVWSIFDAVLLHPLDVNAP